jgi:hypothetical protein
MKSHGTMLTQGQSVLLHPTESYYFHNPQRSTTLHYKKPIQFLGVSTLFSKQLFQDDTVFIISSSKK